MILFAWVTAENLSITGSFPRFPSRKERAASRLLALWCAAPGSGLAAATGNCDLGGLSRCFPHCNVLEAGAGRGAG